MLLTPGAGVVTVALPGRTPADGRLWSRVMARAEQPAPRTREDQIRRAAGGDHRAFQDLAATLVDRLYNTARLVLRDADAAHDAVQEALVRAWRDLPGLRDPDRFDAWIYRLLTRACYDEMRRRRRQLAGAVRDLEEVTLTASDTTGDVARRDELERGFRHLSADHRAVLVLYHYVGLPIDDVAQTLGVPVGTVKSRIHYALAALRSALEADARTEARMVSTQP